MTREIIGPVSFGKLFIIILITMIQCGQKLQHSQT